MVVLVQKKVVKNLLVFLVIVLLIKSNITFWIKYKKREKEEKIRNHIVYKNGEQYDKEIKYYNTINYNNLKKMLNQEDAITLAVIDNSSRTYDKFLEMINKVAFYKNTNIYLLEISKLSKKNEIAFYELDDELKELESDYIIIIKNKKVIAKVVIDKEEINNIIKSME